MRLQPSVDSSSSVDTARGNKRALSVIVEQAVEATYHDDDTLDVGQVPLYLDSMEVVASGINEVGWSLRRMKFLDESWVGRKFYSESDTQEIIEGVVMMCASMSTCSNSSKASDAESIPDFSGRLSADALVESVCYEFGIENIPANW